MAVEQLTQVLRDATAAVGPEYFLLPIHGGGAIYRGRVYCYELYHQMRLRWPEGSDYRLNGEVDKRGHPYFQDGGGPQPDFVVHQPGHGENYAVIEVKSREASAEGILKDLRTLSLFRNEIRYRRAIYLMYGDADPAGSFARVQKYARTEENVAPIEFWFHPAAGQPAAQVGNIA